MILLRHAARGVSVREFMANARYLRDLRQEKVYCIEGSGMGQETREVSAEEERLEARLSELLSLMRDDYVTAQGADLNGLSG